MDGPFHGQKLLVHLLHPHYPWRRSGQGVRGHSPGGKSDRGAPVPTKRHHLEERPRLPSKACKLTAALMAKAYSAAGQAASALHAMAILQVHQVQGDSSQVHGTTVCDALLPHSRPRPILPVAKRVRFGDDIPPHAPLASSVWDPGSSVRMPQNAPPSVPSTPSPFRCTTTGMSIVPLEPLAQRLEAWLTLPSLSHWLTCTIRLGYAIQFARRPPKFNGVLETLVAVRNAPVLREKIAVLLAKDAIEPIPPAEKRQGFYSPYFIVPKKLLAFDQSWICKFWTGLCTSSRSRCGRAGALSNASSPRIGLQRSTWRMKVYSHVVLRPWPGYVPKVPTKPFRDQVVNLQALPSEEADPALALLCPVRALRIYVNRTRSVRSSEQLFVCHGGQQKGRLSPNRGWPTR